jgi:hypothetical protein
VSQLRARAWSHYREVEGREAQVGLDEIASSRHLQRTGENEV